MSRTTIPLVAILIWANGCDSAKQENRSSKTPAIVEHIGPKEMSPDPDENSLHGDQDRDDEHARTIKHIKWLSTEIENAEDQDVGSLFWKRGVAYEGIGEYDKSIDDLTKAVEIEPDYISFFSRGKAYNGKKDYHRALADFLAAAKNRPTDYRSLNSAALLLATSPIDSDRNGARALEFAKRACEETLHEDFICMNTLACAYAETGDFENAIKWELNARDRFVHECEVEHGPGATDYRRELSEYERRTELFRDGKPFRQLVSVDRRS
jgi:tetratricopeptide (TPR) repeat protein